MKLPQGQVEKLHCQVRLNPSEPHPMCEANWTWIVGETMCFYAVTGYFWRHWNLTLPKLIDKDLRDSK